jgi:hypothetical protein
VWFTVSTEGGERETVYIQLARMQRRVMAACRQQKRAGGGDGTGKTCVGIYASAMNRPAGQEEAGRRTCATDALGSFDFNRMRVSV